MIRKLAKARTLLTYAIFVLAFKLTYICNFDLPALRHGII